MAKRDRVFRYGAIGVITLSAMWLIVHFELVTTTKSLFIRFIGYESEVSTTPLAGRWVCEKCVLEGDTEPPMGEGCDGPQEFKGGTLWKPEGENNGNLVVLLAESYPDFHSCEVKRRDGSYEPMTYTGRSNGNRQTFRGSRPGGPYYAGKLGGGGVLCFLPEAGGVCEFLIPGPPKDRHE